MIARNTREKNWNLQQTDTCQMVGFKVGDEEFCLDIKWANR